KPESRHLHPGTRAAHAHRILIRRPASAVDTARYSTATPRGGQNADTIAEVMRLFALFLLGGAVVLAPAQDWPQHLGPTRDGVYAGELPARRVAWTKEVGQGFSAPVVAGGRLILFHRLRDRETVQCFDAKTGRQLWSYDYPTRYRDDFGFDEGPRATPAISAGRVYTFGAEGVLHALDFATGKKLWSVDTREKFGAAKGFFGAANSPLVDGGRVLLNVGGAK